MNERSRRELEEKGVDVARVEKKAEEIMTEIVDEYSIAEIRYLANRLTIAARDLRYRKPGDPFKWNAD